MSTLDLNIIDLFHGDTPVLKVMKGDVEKWPLYDAKVEYIEGDGYAYINTGLKITSTTQFDFSLYIAELQSNNWFFGGRKSSSTGYMMCQLDVTNQRYLWRYGNSNNAVSSGNTLVYGAHRVHNTTAARSLVITNPNTTYTLTRTATTFSSDALFMILSYTSTEGTAPSSGSPGMKFYSGKMWQDGTLVRDFIPVRVGQVGYLYDKASKTLFGNANSSGAFIIGPDK